MDETVTAARVARQAIYAHSPSRNTLLQAVTQHITAQVARALTDPDLERSGAIDALGRWVDAVPQGDDELERHKPAIGRPLRLIERGAVDASSTE